MDGVMNKGKKANRPKGGREKRENMRLKCNVLERERDIESRASHAVRRNCTLAECGENKEEEKAADYRLPFDLLLFTHPTAQEEPCLYNSPFEHNKPRRG